MLETLTTSYIELSNASKHNPIMAGVFSLWGLSVLTYLLRNLPLTIATFVYNQLTTSMTFNTAGDESNLIIFNNFNPQTIGFLPVFRQIVHSNYRIEKFRNILFFQGINRFNSRSARENCQIVFF